jgi:broad specificity phosphatase PhoE
MLFYLVRHGAKAVRPEILSGRAPGVHLSAQGQAQALWVTAQLAHAGIARIIASPRERAKETAEPLADRLRLRIEESPAIDEMDVGAWTGLDTAGLVSVREFDRFNRFRSLTRVPGGETMLEVQARFVGAMLRWRDESPGPPIALFTHAEPIRAALVYFSGGSLDYWWRWEVGLGSITTIELGPEGCRLLQVNCHESS